MTAATEETKQEFIERYMSGRQKPNGTFAKFKIALPCDCDDGGGPTHWAAIPRDPMLIAHHLQFHAPENTPWPDEIERPE